jgi:hypothetical protein
MSFIVSFGERGCLEVKTLITEFEGDIGDICDYLQYIPYNR